MKNSPKKLFQSMQNTLNLLTDNGLTIYHNNPLYQACNGEVMITWPNHVPGKHNCEPSFGKILQYRRIIETGAYTCLLLDGSMVRAAYSFEDDCLVSHSLLWWPSPFVLDSSDLKLGQVLDLFDLYADSTNWHKDIQMRTPVRFDFDPANASDDHPASHVHMQSGNCRISVDSPICFNRFIRFIFRNYYCDSYKQHFFWDDLQIERLYCNPAFQPISPKHEFFSWRS